MSMLRAERRRPERRRDVAEQRATREGSPREEESTRLARRFPMREEVEDHAGRMRAFVINCHEGGLGFTVRAEEEGRRGDGYQFAVYSETSPYSALGN